MKLVEIETTRHALHEFLELTGELFAGRFNSASLQFSSITAGDVLDFLELAEQMEGYRTGFLSSIFLGSW